MLTHVMLKSLFAICICFGTLQLRGIKQKGGGVGGGGGGVGGGWGV